jgi:hypothetical protein
MSLEVRKSVENPFVGPLSFELFDSITQTIIVQGLGDYNEAVAIARDLNALRRPKVVPIHSEKVELSSTLSRINSMPGKKP